MPAALVIVFAGMLGAAFGSFLNVVMSRIPRGESLVRPPSHCQECGRRLSWWENIPVASYLALGGKCRTCRAPIGVRHLVVEAAAGIAAALAAAGMVIAGGARNA